jgi:hypothetical protein
VQIPGVGTSSQPSLALVGSVKCAAWKGVEGDESQYWSTSADGVAWFPQRQIPQTWSSVGPAISSFRGDLIAAWKGAGNDERIWWSRLAWSAGADDWAPQAVIENVGSAAGPALVEFGVGAPGGSVLIAGMARRRERPDDVVQLVRRRVVAPAGAARGLDQRSPSDLCLKRDAVRRRSQRG